MVRKRFIPKNNTFWVNKLNWITSWNESLLGSVELRSKHAGREWNCSIIWSVPVLPLWEWIVWERTKQQFSTSVCRTVTPHYQHSKRRGGHCAAKCPFSQTACPCELLSFSIRLNEMQIIKLPPSTERVCEQIFLTNLLNELILVTQYSQKNCFWHH